MGPLPWMSEMTRLPILFCANTFSKQESFCVRFLNYGFRPGGSCLPKNKASTYWLTDEAVSTYSRSAGLFGLEMHSPIMCIAQGIPAIFCRFDEQTSKGYMWRDIGPGDWLFDMDTPSRHRGIDCQKFPESKNRSRGFFQPGRRLTGRPENGFRASRHLYS